MNSKMNVESIKQKKKMRQTECASSELGGCLGCGRDGAKIKEEESE